MKKVLLFVLVHAMAIYANSQVNYSTNISTGPAMTYKSTYLPKIGADFNFEFANGFLLGFGWHLGRNSMDLVVKKPGRVGKNRSSQIHLGLIQHPNDRVAIQTYIGLARFRNVYVTNQEDNKYYLAWLAKNLLGNTDEYEARYLQEVFVDIGVPIGVNFVFKRKRLGWHFGYYAIVAKHHEIGFKIGMTIGSNK